MPRHEPWNAERASEIIARYRHLKGATLPILHALQETFGCVPEAAVPLVAEALNLSRAEVLGLTERVRTIPIVEPEVTHSIGLVVPHRNPLTPLINALVHEARELVPILGGNAEAGRPRAKRAGKAAAR